MNNSNRIINSWLAQLNLDARDRTMTRIPLAASAAVAPSERAGELVSSPARLRPRWPAGRVRGHRDSARPGLSRPCLGLG